MPIELYPSVAKIKRNGVYENLPGFVPETGSVATQQMIATGESINVAQYVHNKGEYFRLNDTLYQAIVKINVGDSIVVGTNCEVAVLGNDVTHIANSIAEYELGIATAPHTTGEYFMVGETLYVATDDIQVGDSLSTSTNCRIAIVGNELSSMQTEITHNRYALQSGAYIPFIDEMVLLDGRVWTQRNGKLILDSWTGVRVASNELKQFGDVTALITLASNYRVNIIKAQADGTYVEATGWVTTNIPYTFESQYYYAFNFSKGDGSQITGEAIKENCSLNGYTLLSTLSEKVANSVTEIVPDSWTNGYYLSGTSGTYIANTSFKYSSPIYIGQPCTLKIYSRGYSTNVNILSQTSEKGGYYKEVLRSIDNVARWYSVDITEVGYYIVCSHTAIEPIIFVTNIKNTQNSNILAAFSKLICCGDSLTYGLVYDSASSNRQAKTPINEALSMMTGVDSIRYATAGYSAKDWWDNNNSHLNENGLYIIFLGTNGGLTDTVATDCSGNDITNYADTNTGCYGKILRTLQINNKTAVLIKPPAGSATTQGVVQQLADKYGFVAISLPDLTNNYYHYAPHNTGYKNDVHYNDIGYVHLANCINYAINNLSERSLFLIAPYST